MMLGLIMIRTSEATRPAAKSCSRRLAVVETLPKSEKHDHGRLADAATAKASATKMGTSGFLYQGSRDPDGDRNDNKKR